MIPRLNEGSACFVKAKFFDRADTVSIPSLVEYRVDCETTGQVLLDWTLVTPASVVEVQINAPLNLIINRSNAIERKVVTFRANNDVPDNAFTDIQEYDLVNLQGVNGGSFLPDYRSN